MPGPFSRNLWLSNLTRDNDTHGCSLVRPGLANLLWAVLATSEHQKSQGDWQMSGNEHRAPNFTTGIGRASRFGGARIVVALGLSLSSLPAGAVTPDSPEVRQVVDKGLKYLETTNDERLGGKCLVALAFLKNGASHGHRRVVEAIEACRSLTEEQIRANDVYSNGLAIIFLADLDPRQYRDLLERYAKVLEERQKSHGGWGYELAPAGDTSQTQYAILSYWQLMQAGVPPKVSSVEAGANWLLRTQDPGGGWGYQGIDPGSFNLTDQERLTLSMLTAGLGSTLICANVLGALQPGDTPRTNATAGAEQVPAALRPANVSTSRIKTLVGGKLDRGRVIDAVTKGQKLFDKTFEEFREAEYPYYVLYSIERYKSFEEYLTGKVEEEPEWYDKGFEFAREQQAAEGYWHCPSGQPCATAFTILFLSRSTQKSIKARLGEGTLVGGRGLSANLARMKLKQGRLVKERKPTEIDDLLTKLEDADNEELDGLLNDSVTLDTNNLGPEGVRRLEQVIKNGSPEARLVSVKAIADLRNLDYVPALLYGLTDPDPRVVHAARDGLMFVSRRFDGFGPPDNFNETQRYDALDKWKNWYRTVRPNAVLNP